MKNEPPIAVILLTYNEEINISASLKSLGGWSDNIFILDSFSTDRTLGIAKQYGCKIFQNRFEDYAKQRNFALSHLPIETELVLFLDADEWLTEELKEGIAVVVGKNPKEDGFSIKRCLIWMGKRSIGFRTMHGRCGQKTLNF